MPDNLNQIMDYLELRKKNMERQTGVSQEEEPEIQIEGNTAPQVTPETSTEPQRSPFEQILQTWGNRGSTTQDVSGEAARRGYGTSQYDEATPFVPGMDIQDTRAREQSDFAKIGMGFTKMATTALATAANTTVGTVFGAFASGAEMVREAVDGNMSAGEILRAGVNNPVSEWLVDFQRQADEWFPNYRTKEERTEQYQREWYKHMGDANFIGDVFIKNLGFTLGAMAGGAAWSRAFGPLIKRATSDILKGAVLAAEGDAEAKAAMEGAVNAWRVGRISKVEAEQLLKNIKNAGKMLNKADARMQLFGAAISAMGEGSAEGLMAKDEFLTQFKQENDEKFFNEYQNLENDILMEGDPRYVNKGNRLNIETRKIEPFIELTEDGKLELQRRRQEVSDKYKNYLEKAEEQGEKLASTTFLLNLPILTSSNLVQFGKMFSGGWKTARSRVRGIRGNISLGEATNAAGDYARPAIEGGYRSVGNKVLRTLEKGARNATSEATEEMLQGTASSGAKQVAMAHFNNAGYDPDATASYRDWFAQMAEGGSEYLSDIKNWQEGFMGALTGILGVPSFRFRKGQWWSGGVIGAAMEAGEEIDAERKAAEKLNEIVKDKKFQQSLHDYIRLEKFSDQMDEAAVKNDQYAWHTAENEKLISSVVAFAHAGKLDDLKQLVDEYGSMTEADAPRIRAAFETDTEYRNLIQNKTDAEIVDMVKERAKEINEAIDDYKEIYDSLQARAPMDASDAFLEEMLFTEANIKQFEKRFLRLYDETMQALENSPEMKGLLDTEVKDNLHQFKNIRDIFESYFTADPSRPVPKRVEDLFNSSLDDVAKALGATKNSEQGKKLEDMKKLAEDRRLFYEKLQRMQDPKTTKKAQEDFNKEAITPEKVEAEAEKQAAEQQAEEMKTLADMKKKEAEIRERYKKTRNGNEHQNFLATLKRMAKTNPDAKKFLDIRAKQLDVNKFVNGINNDYANLLDVVADPRYNLGDNEMMTARNIGLPYMLHNLYKRAESEEDFSSEKDIFPTLEEYMADVKNASQADYPMLLEMAKRVLNRYNQIDEDTGIIDDNPAPAPNPTPQPAPPAEKAERSSYDSAPEGSSTPPPVAPDAKPAEPAPAEAAPASKAPEEKPAPSAPAPAQEEQPEEQLTEDDYLDDQMDGNTVTETDYEASMEELGTAPESSYHASVPEVDSEQAANARVALRRKSKAEIEAADLSDFVEYKKDENGDYVFVEGKRVPTKHAEYAETSEALESRNAFEELDTNVKVGDKIVFIIDPRFPRFEGKHQVLMAVRRPDDSLQVITVLHRQTDEHERKYRGLRKLYSDIEQEYEDWATTHDAGNEIFEFSKESEIYLMLNGLININREDRKGKPLGNDIEGYDPQAPILYITPDNRHFIARGPKDADTKINPAFFSEENIGKNKRKGALFYLVKQPNGTYAPVRLTFESFDSTTMLDDNPVFTNIRTEIANLVSVLNNTDADNYERQLVSFRKAVKDLGSWLNISKIDIRLDKSEEDGSVSLLVETNETDADGNPIPISASFKSGETAPRSVIDFFASLERSINIREDRTVKQDGTVEGKGTIAHLDEYIQNGLLFTNAEKLRPKGVDFRCYCYAEDENGNWDFIKSEAEGEDNDEDEGGFSEPNEDLLFQIEGARPSPVDRAELDRQKEKNRSITLKRNRLFNELQKANGITNMQMNDRKLRDKLKRTGMSNEVIDFLINGLQDYPSLRKGTPYQAFIALSRAIGYDIQQAYNDALQRPVDEELDRRLIDLLQRFHINVRLEDLKKRFGRDDVLGAYDVIEKTIYLANNPERRNEMTVSEEFAHAFLELMGTSLNYGADSEDFKFLYNTVVDTDIYRQVYAGYKDIYKNEDGTPDEYRIRKEAIGQALAAAINHNWNASKLAKTQEEKGFWNKLREWFNKILDAFRGENVTFEQTIDSIAKEILSGDLSRLNKVDDEGYSLLDYADTIENQNKLDGGKALGFMQYFSNLGNLITGSLAYRRQGTVYRSKLDSLHDIDMIVPAEVHGIHNVELLSKYNFNTRNNIDFYNEVINSPYFRQIKKQYPKIVFPNVFNNGHYITANAVYSENEELSRRFANLTGSYADRLDTFTEEERRQIYLFDFFLRTPEQNNVFYDDDYKLNLVDYKTPFREKLRMGRAKDLYDYQMWKAFNEFASAPSTADVLFQKAPSQPSRPEKRFAKQARKQERDLQKSMLELPSAIQDSLKAKGYTEEQYDNLPDTLKEQVLKCAGA